MLRCEGIHGVGKKYHLRIVEDVAQACGARITVAES
jgi:dTDP-4-amino-4,6-dideoxygalactose transaminase